MRKSERREGMRGGRNEEIRVQQGISISRDNKPRRANGVLAEIMRTMPR